MRMSKLIDLKDGSFGSRKFLLTLFCILLLTAVALGATIFPSIVAILPTFAGGLLGLVSLYFTGNLMNKHIVGNNISKFGFIDNPDKEEE